MYHNDLRLLHERYRIEQPESRIPLEAFSQLINLFPSILVLRADGHVDTPEMFTLYKLARHAIPTEPEDLVKKEVRSLTWGAEYWKEPFLRVLKQKVAVDKIGLEVIEYMIAAASSSTGDLQANFHYATSNPYAGVERLNAKPDTDVQFISDDEKRVILQIAEYLELDQDDQTADKIMRYL